MSFAAEVKTELARRLPDDRHCLIAETAAILRFAGTVSGDDEQGTLIVETDNVQLAKKYLSLIKKAFDISVDLNIRRGTAGKANRYRIMLASGEENAETERYRRVWRETADWDDPEFAQSLLEYPCCRRAFIRGAFLSAGTMSDPGKSYHFEIVCGSERDAGELAGVIATFGIEPKLTARKRKFLVYIKDSESIVDILNVMDAPQALMHLENVRIIKDIKNGANRQSNCDSANISKTVKASRKQLGDIRLIQSEIGLDQLAPQLKEMAEIRLEHPEESLKDLGDYLDPPVSKSGVNHRLARIGEIADDIRRQQTGSCGAAGQSRQTS